MVQKRALGERSVDGEERGLPNGEGWYDRYMLLTNNYGKDQKRENTGG